MVNNTAGGFYAVSDNGSYGLEKDELIARTIATKDEAQPDGSTKLYRTLNGSELDWSTKSGWYIQLNTGNTPLGEDAGERVVSRPDLLRNVLFFSTMIPSGQACSAGGYGWLMSVDLRTGLAPAKFAIFDGTGDGQINSADQGLVGQLVNEGIPNRSGFLNGKMQYTPTSLGTNIRRDINVGGAEREGRLSWEEVTPY
jgi:type IV pilus assembly protein PilY1